MRILHNERNDWCEDMQLYDKGLEAVLCELCEIVYGMQQCSRCLCARHHGLQPESVMRVGLFILAMLVLIAAIYGQPFQEQKAPPLRYAVMPRVEKSNPELKAPPTPPVQPVPPRPQPRPG